MEIDDRYVEGWTNLAVCEGLSGDDAGAVKSARRAGTSYSTYFTTNTVPNLPNLAVCEGLSGDDAGAVKIARRAGTSYST